MQETFLGKFGVLLGCALIGAVVFVFFYDEVAPRASVDLKYSRDEIKNLSRSYLERLGYDPSRLQQDARFSFDGAMHLYLSDRNGLKKANEMIRADSLSTHHWYLYWYDNSVTKSQNVETFDAWVSPAGRILGFSHGIRDTVSKASLTAEEAERRAAEFLERQSIRLAGFSLKKSESTKQPNRTDHRFVWAKGDTMVDENVWVRVQGDEIGGFRMNYATVGAFKEELSNTGTRAVFLVSAALAISFLLFFFIVILFLRKYHEGEVGTKTAVLVFLGLYLSCVAAIINQFPTQGATWTVGDLNRFNVRLFALGWQLLIVQVFFSVMAFAAWSVGESSARSMWPKKLAAMDSALFRKFFTLDVAESVLRGYCWGMILIAGYLVVVIVLTSANVSGVYIESGITSNPHDALVPFLSPLLEAFSIALLVEIVFRLFFISYIKERTGKQWLAVLVSTVMWALCGMSLWTLPLGFLKLSLSVVALAAFGFAFSLLFLKYDILTTIVANTVILFLSFAVPLFASSASYFQTSTALALGVFCLPLLVAIGGFIRRERFEFTLQTIPAHIQRITERERMAKELEIARRVQMSLLPKANPSTMGYDIAGMCIPAREVGGDYYDFVNVGGRKIGIAIGDVSGKGVPAAIYMTLTKGILQSHAEENISPKKVLSKVNSLMYRTIDRSSFVSMFYAILDMETRRIRFARAGQCPVVVAQRNDEQATFLTPKGMALGLEVGKVFDSVLEEQELELNAGEVLVFYTDGFTEAMNEAGVEFGEERLLESITRHRSKSASDIIAGICKEVDAFAKGFPQHDDMTMVVVKVT
jgi:hypothetical protein